MRFANDIVLKFGATKFNIKTLPCNNVRGTVCKGLVPRLPQLFITCSVINGNGTFPVNWDCSATIIAIDIICLLQVTKSWLGQLLLCDRSFEWSASTKLGDQVPPRAGSGIHTVFSQLALLTPPLHILMNTRAETTGSSCLSTALLATGGQQLPLRQWASRERTSSRL